TDSDQIIARFQKDKPGPRKGVSVKRDISILSQIPNLNVIKEIKEKAEAVAASLKSIFILDPKPDRMRAYTPLADRLASDGSNIAGVIAGLPEDQKKEFEDSLTNYVRPLPEKDLKKIWAEPIGRFKTDAMLYCVEEWGDGNKSEFDARSMSDGTLRFIAIVSALLSARSGSTIVIEEVDNGLHPSRAGELVMALKNLGEQKGIDIICTTHNPVLIDALGPEMLPFISYVSRSNASGYSEIHLLEDAPHLLRLLASYTPGDMMTKGFLSNEIK
ncbi:MAG: ATP-binding protein, partial [Muribaculaceae bacterium]|nr:ATP-binding protein [Muribaculaceae bacterium]